MAGTTSGVKGLTPSSVRVSDPWTMMRQEMNDLFTNFWGNSGMTAPSVSFLPAIDVAEKENRFELRLDVPGMDAKDIEIKAQGNTVTVSGHRKEEEEEKGKTYHRMERRSGSFSRTVTLPCEVTDKEAAAEYTNGVLSIVLPKCESSTPKKINIKS